MRHANVFSSLSLKSRVIYYGVLSLGREVSHDGVYTKDPVSFPHSDLSTSCFPILFQRISFEKLAAFCLLLLSPFTYLQYIFIVYSSSGIQSHSCFEGGGSTTRSPNTSQWLYLTLNWNNQLFILVENPVCWELLTDERCKGSFSKAILPEQDFYLTMLIKETAHCTEWAKAQSKVYVQSTYGSVWLSQNQARGSGFGSLACYQQEYPKKPLPGPSLGLSHRRQRKGYLGWSATLFLLPAVKYKGSNQDAWARVTKEPGENPKALVVLGVHRCDGYWQRERARSHEHGKHGKMEENGDSDERALKRIHEKLWSHWFVLIILGSPFFVFFSLVVVVQRGESLLLGPRSKISK